MYSSREKKERAKKVPIFALKKDESMLNVLKGDLQQKLPLQKPRLVRIFLLTSSQTDFELERNCFWREILPELQQYCLPFSAEVLVIDPYQCGDVDLNSSPELIQTLIDEINLCRDTSTGVFFICMLSEKYGPSALPPTIKVDEFNHIRTAAFEASKDVRLLDEWYKQDNNINPAVFALQSQSQKRQLDPKNRAILVDIVQQGAHHAFKDGLINQVNTRHQERFYYSAMEMLLQAALANKDSLSKMFVFFRKFEGYNFKNTDPSFTPFIDQPSDDPNGLVKASERLANLKNTLSAKLDKSNLETVIASFEDSADMISWLQSRERERYLDDFVQQVTYKLKQLIDIGFRDASMVSPSAGLQQLAYNEATVHLNWAMTKRASNLLGHQPLLDKMRDACKSAHKQKKGLLLQVTGDECSGRTAILCEIAHVARSWLSEDAIVMPRFVTLTPGSVFAHELWQNVCVQIALSYDLELDEFKGAANMETVTKLVSDCLEKVSSGKNPLFILFDDVHLVKFCRAIGNMKIIPADPIPPNVFIIVSRPSGVNPVGYTVGSKNSFAIPPLDEGNLMEIITNSLSIKYRKISTDQQGVLKIRYGSLCPSPFVSILLAKEASKWPSHFIPKENAKMSNKTLTWAIENKLQQLEQDHGIDLVTWICQYLAASPYGLTETELLDAVCCNRDLSRLGSSKSSKLNGFPICSWLALKKDMEPLMKRHILDSRVILFCSHHSVTNAMKHRYLGNIIDIKKCHGDLADLFCDVWSDMGPNISMNDDSEILETPRTSLKLARYAVFPQPLRSAQIPGEEASYNVRRVRNLWYQLLHAGNIDNLKENALCNFAYLDAMVQCCGLAHLISVIEDTLQQMLEHDLQCLYYQNIIPALPSLTKDPDQLGAEIIGRLRYTRAKNSPYLNNMVDQAMGWVDNYTKRPLLVPLTCWIQPPSINMVGRFQMKNWKAGKTIVQPTVNHQHLLVAGNVATGSVGVIAMYHISSETLVRSFTGHTDRVTSLTLSRSGQFFISTSMDKTVRSWDLIQGHCIRNLCPHTQKVLCSILTHDDQSVVTGSADSSAKVISLDNGRVLRSFQDHTGPVVALAMTSLSEFLITGSGDFVVMVWSLETGELCNKLGGLMAPVCTMALTSNDAFLVVSCEDETLRVFSLCSGVELHELQGHDGKIWSLASCYDDCQLFAGCADGKIYCYDLHNGEVLNIHECAGGKPVTSLKLSNDNFFLLSGNGDYIHVWNVELFDDPTTRVHEVPTKVILSAIGMSRDQRYTVCGTQNGAVALWDLEIVQCVWTSVHSPRSSVKAIQFNSDATIVLSGTKKGNIVLWAMSSGSQLKEYKGHEAPICCIQVLADGSKVLSMDTNDILHIWQLHTPEEPDQRIAPIVCKSQPKEFLRISCNDRDFLGKSAENPKEIRIWSLGEDNSITLRSKIGHNDEVTCHSVSNNGRVMVTGSADQSLKVWDVENGFLTQVLVGHETSVCCCAVADDERVVISASTDNLVIVWDVETGEVLHGINKHQQTNTKVTSVAVTSDGSVACSGDESGWLYAWDTESGTVMSIFNVHIAIKELLCSVDGNRIILRLDSCPHLPILCLHNTPAGLLLTNSGSTARQTRAPSISSIGSNYSASSGHGTLPGAAVVNVVQTATVSTGGVPSSSSQTDIKRSSFKRNQSQHQLKTPRKTFDKLERSRSRASMYGDGGTAGTGGGKPEKPSLHTGAKISGKKSPQSSVCVIV